MTSNFMIAKGAVVPWVEVILTKNGVLSQTNQAPLYGCAEKQVDPNWIKLVDEQNQPIYTDIKFELYKCGRVPTLMPTNGVCEVDSDGYTVRYKWASEDTMNGGCFYGRFVVTFKDNFGKFIWPMQLEALSIDITSPNGGCC